MRQEIFIMSSQCASFDVMCSYSQFIARTYDPENMPNITLESQAMATYPYLNGPGCNYSVTIRQMCLPNIWSWQDST